MLLFELYKVTPDSLTALICNRKHEVIYYGLLNNLDVDILQSRVTYLDPISAHELHIKLDI